MLIEIFASRCVLRIEVDLGHEVGHVGDEDAVCQFLGCRFIRLQEVVVAHDLRQALGEPPVFAEDRADGRVVEDQQVPLGVDDVGAAASGLANGLAVGEGVVLGQKQRAEVLDESGGEGLLGELVARLRGEFPCSTGRTEGDLPEPG